ALYDASATKRTGATSGSRHFYKKQPRRALEVASGTLFSVPGNGLDSTFNRMQHPARAGRLSLFDHLAGDREQCRRRGESGRLGGSSFDDRLDGGRLHENKPPQPTRKIHFAFNSRSKMLL